MTGSVSSSVMVHKLSISASADRALGANASTDVAADHFFNKIWTHIRAKQCMPHVTKAIACSGRSYNQGAIYEAI